MKRSCAFAALVSIALSVGAAQVGEDAPNLETLWRIGAPDGTGAELALAPGGYGEYRAEPLFVVGTSRAETDWPYVHPGPADAWAGSREQGFRIVFGLSEVSGEPCVLRLGLVDTHGGQPPVIEVAANEYRVTEALPPGAGSDDSISGNPKAGKPHTVSVSLPATALQPGNNTILIRTTSGSWLLYDYVELLAPTGTALAEIEPFTSVLSVDSPPVLVEYQGEPAQPVRVALQHAGDRVNARLEIGGAAPVDCVLEPGPQTLEAYVPAVQSESTMPVRLVVDGQVLAEAEATLGPVRQWEIHLLHHTHLDIGYTHVQSEVEAMQWAFLEEAIQLAAATADYPPEAQFKWLPEGLWAVESYLGQATPEQRDAFIAAAQAGSIGLDALFANQLTALCRPEELIELTGYARRLAREHGLTFDSAMITDVPGYTWGIIPVLAQSGVRYFSIGPNATHRIGYTLSDWGDRPFYWVSPSGEERVLCWVAARAYSWFHGHYATGTERPETEARLFEYLEQLERDGFPYDMIAIRYNIGGDNGPPDPTLPDFIAAWNRKYLYPRMAMTTTSEVFREFERRYGQDLPEVRGDFTPYWEDGAASSARETALVREAAERLVQAKALWALLDPAGCPEEDFRDAWRNVLLYNEHTWGAHNSITEPESDFALSQWRVKQAFALDADRQSRDLLKGALRNELRLGTVADTVLVYNTESWARDDLVTLPATWERAGDLVRDAAGRPAPSQRLSTGELVFLARGVPPMGAARYTLHDGAPHPAPSPGARVDGLTLETDALRVTVDERTGAITSLVSRDHGGIELVDGADGSGLNDYLYVAGRDPAKPLRASPATFVVADYGPLVASLRIESDAPGCHALAREVRVIAGLDRVDIVATLDKQNVHEKEAAHLAFPFDVPGGVVRMDTPWAVVRPDVDQLTGACKNYFTVQRWVDVSNERYGVTWATVDAPLIEIGRLTCDAAVVGWLREAGTSTRLYSYVMNNYWETNYKAGQEGVTTFRYAVRPHGAYDGVSAHRFGVERSRPLIVVPVDTDTATPESGFRVEPEGVVMTSAAPSADGRAWIVRLFGASGQHEEATIRIGPEGGTARMALCDLSGEPIQALNGPARVPSLGMVTLRVERP